jgi:hypothetical protein
MGHRRARPAAGVYGESGSIALDGRNISPRRSARQASASEGRRALQASLEHLLHRPGDQAVPRPGVAHILVQMNPVDQRHHRLRGAPCVRLLQPLFEEPVAEHPLGRTVKGNMRLGHSRAVLCPLVHRCGQAGDLIQLAEEREDPLDHTRARKPGELAHSSLQPLGEHRCQQLILAGEVPVDGAARHERRSGRPAAVVRLALALVAIRAVVGIVSGSGRTYLATEIGIDALLATIVLGSLATARPFAGWFTAEILPLPQEALRSDAYRAAIRTITFVWAGYFLLRGLARLAALVTLSTDRYALVVALTEAPFLILLLAWSVYYALAALRGSAGVAGH